mmetsp:Transcript_26497/g.62045  ORF Transcript_26497/g.62045 Transcript_26497/m.62045 type:complete len:231 (+) Transcript_26497:271-963(+)
MRSTSADSLAESRRSAPSSSPSAAPASPSAAEAAEAPCAARPRFTYASRAAPTRHSTYGSPRLPSLAGLKWSTPASSARRRDCTGSSRWKYTREAMEAAVRREESSRLSPGPASPSASAAAAAEPPSAMASRSGSDSATSCHNVSTTASRRARAAETRAGDGSESMARRPEAVDTGAATRDGPPMAVGGPDRTAVAIILVTEGCFVLCLRRGCARAKQASWIQTTNRAKE